MQNPLGSYRRTQRELRHSFEAFTRANCPNCPTPCCMRPARIAPTDILLAEATGWRSAVAAMPSGGAGSETDAQAVSSVRSAEDADIVTSTATRMLDALSMPQNDTKEDGPAEQLEDAANVPLPCEFLGASGCTFPTDLRPFGCTTYICKYMYARMDRATLTRIKRLARELEDKHTILLRTARRSGLSPESGE